MVLLQDLADDTSALAVLLGGLKTFAMHGVENPPMHGLEPIANVGERTPDDDRHGVVHVGASHLVFDTNRDDMLGEVLGIHGVPGSKRRKGVVYGVIEVNT
jgi:hypothetical protein